MHVAEAIGRHGDSGKPTWANERVCLCGAMYRIMPPGPSFEDHLADVLVSKFDIREKESNPEKCTSRYYNTHEDEDCICSKMAGHDGRHVCCCDKRWTDKQARHTP
jgi:hypothetical protein